ncbi:COX15/CtaA family protein [Flavobacteriaceae bacterium]|nr:COX15/CtaA family protein [Flavobacteriaceae bacterium]
MKTSFRFWVGVSIVLVYGVIAAGAVVRMTGSGMGCPDWPKCFGYLIPPTERVQLDWYPNHSYTEGEVIIVEEELRIALTDFTSKDTYKAKNWDAYTKHDYALFNPLHTWIEFINRLLGALGGLATLIVGILSFWQWKKSKIIPLVSWGIVFGMGFQAWLGKTVVDSNLQPFKITIHMIMALVIVALLLYLYFISQKEKSTGTKNGLLKNIALITLLLTLLQIGMGTQVRQFVDTQIDLLGENAKNAWLDPAPFLFYVHRSFSLLVTGLNLFLFFRLKKLSFLSTMPQWILGLIGAEIFTGILMYYFDFPFSSQPLHLLLASLLFGAQSYLVLQLYQPAQNNAL